MTQIIRSLADLSGRYDALFCDLWGCLHNGVTPFPAAVAALQAFRAQGGKVILVTNAPRPKSSIVKQLDAMGLPRDTWDDVASSGDATQAAMLSGAAGSQVYHIGAPKDEPFFTDFEDDLAALAATSTITRVPLDQATGVICTGLADDLTETPEDYRAKLLMAKAKGLKMLCANPDIIVDMGERRLYCAGALAKAYEDMGGEALYYGKPHPPIYDLARKRLGMEEARILCVGDGIHTDVQGGVGEGLDTLFVTGGIAAHEFGPDVENPDAALLHPWLEGHQLSATYAIGFLR
ncbi:TIGR01459 family HAD-type hydrolase [Pseudorhodobacter sp. MZDSW-24AT]|uniref:TIGR01459 family HAD-type hydrolase n=1 Tax=Pseudorhodobacter sp. MZDSW-24AT TaxID=2052957 RepID=UPI000C1F5940|nr:TIGR01459 family HAD-type hydrolase [Pseudorhodobacter sp. MZDSW-24AT]PJF07908.1 TIGR01459 family HAD-type hydrolase [Pseudorhodobacter sp. MZDSW-24AT]